MSTKENKKQVIDEEFDDPIFQDDCQRKLDDMGFSQIFAQLYKDELLFNATASSWFYYDGKKYVPAMDEEVTDSLHNLCEERHC